MAFYAACQRQIEKTESSVLVGSETARISLTSLLDAEMQERYACKT